MKFYSAKHKVSGEFVSFWQTADDDGFMYTKLSLSNNECDTPFVASLEQVAKLIKGNLNNDWSIIVYDELKEAVENSMLEIVVIDI